MTQEEFFNIDWQRGNVARLTNAPAHYRQGNFSSEDRVLAYIIHEF